MSRAAFLLAACCLVAAPARAAVLPDPTVQALVDGVSRAELQPVVDELSGETPALIGGIPYTFTTRSSSSGEPIDRAEQYVFERLQSYGLDAVVTHDFPGEDGAPPGRNVIGQIDGTTRPHEIVVVGAHLDSYPWTGAAPGADDDASGVSATLYLARSFAGHRFERTIRFAFFGDEENAPWECQRIGSAGYAAACKAAGETIVAMIQADAIAYDPPESGDAIVEMNTREPENDPGGADRAIAELWLDAIAAYALGGLTPRVVAIGDNWSDHGSFWNNGYPAAMLIAEELDYANPNWHSADDRVATFAWPFYVQVTRSYVALAAHAAGFLPPPVAPDPEPADGTPAPDVASEPADTAPVPADATGDAAVDASPRSDAFLDVADAEGRPLHRTGSTAGCSAGSSGPGPFLPALVLFALVLARGRRARGGRSPMV